MPNKDPNTSQKSPIPAAQEFFNEVVAGWMIQDLDNMESKIPKTGNQAGACNIPIALYIFACMEFLGYLTSTTEIPDRPGATKKRILTYLDDFFGENYKAQIKPYRDQFVEMFRHGMAHEFFAKNAGVSRNKGTLITVDKDAGQVILDADEFYTAFKASTSTLRTRLWNNDAGLAERFVERHNTRIDSHQLNYGKLDLTKTITVTAVSAATTSRKF